MPKLKRASSSLAASRLKKRRKLTITERPQQDSDSDEHDVRQQTRRLRNTEARRIARLDPKRRQQEQTRDTAARRRVRQEDSERRRDEQTRNTASRRRIRLEDPQHSAQEQQVNNARRQQVRVNRPANFRALNYQPETFVNTTSVGLLNVECLDCGALKFSKETEGFCCSKGNVKLDLFQQPPSFLQHLYEGTGSNSNHFLSNIRKYNCAFQMTSFGCNNS